ncbi:hypothetical protein [Amycolatopsis vastitatis]|uniref:Uncharacterized protein n=1 Tax=Amycolatopsis vastitatis TaxID=1905142 RepID=A0A229TEK3_9PSEU|nr:hypothetical protein [Amycolatopsis vastitatis]OXM69334.1 hypothetical protein CF165_07320 [Amycolatopsis vastitatis]
MTDIYALRALRAPRRTEAADDSTLATEWSEVDPDIRTHVQRWQWGGTEFVPQLRELVANNENPAGQAPALAEAFLRRPTAVTVLALRGGVDPAATMPGEDGGPPVPIPGQPGLSVLDRLDRWLVAQDNEPEPPELDEWLRAAAPQSPVDDDADHDGEVEPRPLPLESRSVLYRLFGMTWSRLLDSLAAALLLPQEAELAQRLNRLLLVAGMVERRSFHRRPLTTGEISKLLARRTPLLPDPPFPAVLPEDQVKLVRRATTSDLFVVRKEWRGYVADEIAEIRNVMTGEHHDSRFIRIDESELVETTTSSTDSTTETSAEMSDESNFTEQSKRELDLAIGTKGQVDVSAQYSSVSLDVSAGFTADFSLKDSTDRTTQIAKKAIARAASKIETQTRQERTRRTLTRTELRERHKLDNTSGDHVRGVYRWVARVDRFQIWRYPDRLQLEFEVPEPGRYLLKQLKSVPARAGSVGKPPEFALPAEGLTGENYLALAAKYGATGLPEPPQPVVGTSAAIALMAKDPGTAPTADYWNPPVLTQSVEVAVPPGYAVATVKTNIEVTPFHAMWKREMSESANYDRQENLHTITATVAAGDQMVYDSQAGPGSGPNSIMSSGSPDYLVQYMDGHLHHTGAEQRLADPVVVKLPISVCLVGAWAGNVGIELKCELTEQAKAVWVRDVYDAVRAAYDAWLREWRAEQAMTGNPAELAERSPLRNAEMVQNEVRRHVITWLLGESPFQGRNAVPARAVPPAHDNTPDIDVPAALSSAPTIQFLEQALEWSNLAWVAYPYYWAGRGRWPELVDLETADPALGSFLRAGSIRVVVPARVGFGTAVLHWLTYRQPWLGGSCAPVPGRPMFLSVAREIRDQLMPPSDGEPCDSWEVALPTTLQWLDDKAAGLPLNTMGRLGKPPHEPPDPLLGDDEV